MKISRIFIGCAALLLASCEVPTETPDGKTVSPDFKALEAVQTIQWPVELQYNWKAGNEYVYHADMKDKIELSGQMAKMAALGNLDITTSLDFKLIINSVKPDGTGVGFLDIMNYHAESASGTALASLKDLPSNSISTPIEIDRKGNFNYHEKVQLVIRNNETILLKGSVSQNGTQVSQTATAEVDGQRVTLKASFDPKTGELKGSVEESLVEKAPASIQIKEDDQIIEVLPYQILELFLLPNGKVNKGDNLKVNMMVQDMNYLVDETDKGEVSLSMLMRPSKTNRISASSNGLGAIGADLNGLLTAEDAKGMAAVPTMNAEAFMVFNPHVGTLEQINGQFSTEQGMPGMSIKMASEINLKLTNIYGDPNNATNVDASTNNANSNSTTVTTKQNSNGVTTTVKQNSQSSSTKSSSSSKVDHMGNLIDPEEDNVPEEQNTQESRPKKKKGFHQRIRDEIDKDIEKINDNIDDIKNDIEEIQNDF